MSGNETPRKRRRPALSCEKCRVKKIRCDRKKPCNNCVQSKNVATCRYSAVDAPSTIVSPRECTTKTSTAQSAQSAQSSWGTFDYLFNSPDFRETDFSRKSFTSSRTVPSVENSRQRRVSNEHESSLRASNSDTADIQELRNRVYELEQMLPNSGSAQLPNFEDGSLHPKTVGQPHGSMSKTRFFGKGHWMNSFKQFDGIVSLIQKATRNQKLSKEDFESAEIFQRLDKCKVMARIAKAEHPIKPPIHQDFKSYIPHQELSDKLVSNYLRNFESIYRILHIPSFQAEYARYWNDPQNSSTDFVVKLLLVMAIGACFYQNEKEETSVRSLAPQWVYNAQWWLNAPSEKSRLNTSGLQVQCLLLLARQTNCLGSDLIWISVGSLLRMAFNMGFHRDPRYLPHTSVFSSEIRRRLWATILEMALQSSLDSGMPPLISYNDFDCEPPSNINDIEINETTKTPPMSHPQGHFTQTSIQICLLRSLRVRLEVARRINDFRVDPSYDESLRLGNDIMNAFRDGALIMQANPSLSSVPNDMQPTKFHKNIVSLLTRRFLVALHRSFAMKARTDPRYFYSRKICLDTAMILASSLEDLLPISTLRDDFCRLALVGGGVFKDVFFHDVAMTICLELISQLEQEASDVGATTPMSRSAREPLIHAVETVIELSAHRVVLGETNVKTHLFLSTALGQIRAMEAGTSVEEGILGAAKQSLDICSALLLARTTSIPVNLDEQQSMNELSNLQPVEQMMTDDLFMQSDLNFNIPNSWLFSTWEDTDSWM